MTIFMRSFRLAAACLCLVMSPILALATTPLSATAETPRNIGGVFPHLAMYNDHGECGTGVVVPWAGRLWVATYAPHMPMGSSDKLYEITPELQQIIRPESVGGTPANRMIHRESNQLIISHYFIDGDRNVRVIAPKDMPGRMTANARHLTDPTGKVYFTTMEEGLYEVDVKTLGIKCWINDSNANKGAVIYRDAVKSKLPGYHGKGTYTGQGRLIYANNGENSSEARKDPTTPSGALAEWAGPGEDWQLVLREQFTEVTGPGGIYGNDSDEDPVWSMGWDHRSVILALLDGGAWHYYRLPKASFSYDGAHGWNTEWPRIREIGTGDDLLATMHGTFWHFPKTFSIKNSAGIAPRSNYLKVIGDFARWGDYVVLGCDDSAQSEFLNKRAFKAEKGAPLRSNSNLWFVKPEQLSQLGPALGSGGVWLNEAVKAGQSSDPFLFSGYDSRVLHLGHRGDQPVTFKIEVDREGKSQWTELKQVTVTKNYAWLGFAPGEKGQWIRITPLQDAKGATAWFHYANKDKRTGEPTSIFNGMAKAETVKDVGGVMRSLGGDAVQLGLIAQSRDNDERPFYTLNDKLELVKQDNSQQRGETWAAAAPDPDQIPLKVDGQSILVEEDGKRYRLPLSPDYAEDKPFGEAIGFARRVREVATERDMVNVGGTVYELPARNAGGFQHMRPIASHPFRIHDFCSWRGLFVMTGIDLVAEGDRIIKSDDGKAAVWVGVVDELWQMGKPVGIGGPWTDTKVKPQEASDPYLMYGYDKKKLVITSDRAAKITIQLDPSGTGEWFTFDSLEISPDITQNFDFPAGITAHWVRLISDSEAVLTAEFIYE